MAFDFDKDAMFRLCAGYLAKGLRIIRLNGIYADGRCTCGDPDHRVGGPGERSCGKHPVGRDWREAWAKSEDDILDWLESGVPFNVGVLLGPEGGYIDLEDDTPEATAYRKSLGFDLLETPTWTSGKSVHQLVRFDERLAGAGGVKKPGGLEVRIGANGSSIQSVLPPSWHYSGKQYRWKDGFSIDDVDVAPMPVALVRAIVNEQVVDDRPVSDLALRVVNDGEGRHRHLLMWSWQRVASTLSPHRHSARLIDEMLRINRDYCVPPKTEKEVRTIVHSCLQHYRKRREGGWSPSDDDASDVQVVEREASKIGNDDDQPAATATCGYEMHGLRPVVYGQVTTWEPSDWSLTTVHSDPPEFVLHVPAWENTPCKGAISMSPEQFCSARQVAKAVFTATLSVVLDTDSKAWDRIWRGCSASKKSGGVAVPGVMKTLLDRQRNEDMLYVGTASLRYAQLAGWVLDELAKARTADPESPRPADTGRPTWVDGILYLQWAEVWEEVARMRNVMPGERTRLRKKLLQEVGAQDFPHKRWVIGQTKKEFVAFNLEWMGALERLAGRGS